jgi:hypothetical protein
MRILLVSNTPFLPPTAGNRSRIAQMVGFLQRHGVEVGMLMLPAADVLDWDLDGMRGRLSYFELAQPPRGGRVIDRIRRSLRRPRSASTDAIGVDDWCPRWFRDRVATAAERWGADVLLIEYVFLSACLLPVGTRPGPRPVTVIDSTTSCSTARRPTPPRDSTRGGFTRRATKSAGASCGRTWS